MTDRAAGAGVLHVPAELFPAAREAYDFERRLIEVMTSKIESVAAAGATLPFIVRAEPDLWRGLVEDF